MKRTAFAAIFAALSITAAARADTRTFADARISIDIPDRWTQSSRNKVVVVVDPANEVLVAVRVLGEKGLKDIARNGDRYVADFARDIKWEAPAERDVNGMKAISLDGTARLNENGTPVNIMVAFVTTPANKIAMVLVIITSSRVEKHLGELKGILSSIRPAR